MNDATILVIDDEPQMRKLLEIALSGEGFRVVQAATSKEGIALAVSYQPDLILLDVQLPDSVGIDTLLELRSWYNHGIILISVMDKEDLIIDALDHGATDYVVKPFRTGELLARVRGALKRNGTACVLAEIHIGDLHLDLAGHTLKKGQDFVKLTSTEFDLLSLLMRNSGRVLTHQMILKEVWGVHQQNEIQYLRVFVAQLRKKIEIDYTDPKYILTESGVGYRFCEGSL